MTLCEGYLRDLPAAAHAAAAACMSIADISRTEDVMSNCISILSVYT